MSDSVAYVLITGIVAIPTMAMLLIANRMIEVVHENQSVLFSVPFF